VLSDRKKGGHTSIQKDIKAYRKDSPTTTVQKKKSVSIFTRGEEGGNSKKAGRSAEMVL